MSGSFDNPTEWSGASGAAGTSSPRVRLAAERFHALRAPSAGGRTVDAGTGDTRTRRTSSRNAPSAPIVPAGSVTGRSLTLVITIMCFLASLTAGAVYMMNQTASEWMRDIAGEVTVQVEPRQRTDTDRLAAEVVAFLSRQQGVAQARALSAADTSQLLEPWFGQSEALSALPVPRLIAVELDRANPPNFDVLRGALANNFPGASLDDHRRWQRQVRTITRSFALGGLAILLL